MPKPGFQPDPYRQPGARSAQRPRKPVAAANTRSAGTAASGCSPYRSLGNVVHVPAGTAVEERQIDGYVDDGELLTLPNHDSVYSPEQPPSLETEPLHGIAYTEELLEVWQETEHPHGGNSLDIHRGLQLGGYVEDENAMWTPL